MRTSKGRTHASDLVLLKGGLPSEIALQGGSLESKIVHRGVDAGFKKPKKLFRLTMNRVTLNVENSGSITSLRVAAELNIIALINLSNHNSTQFWGLVKNISLFGL